MINKNDTSDTHQSNMTSQMTRYFPSYTSLPEEIAIWIKEHNKDVIVVCDVAGRIVYVSESIKRILGYEKEQFIGEDWSMTLSESTEKYITEKIETNSKEELFTFEYRHANGNDMWLQCEISKCFAKDLEEHFFVMVLSDITNKKESEEFMIRAEKMSIAGQLAAGIAHEIRNPLTALKGFLQLLQSGNENKEAYYQIMFDELTKIEKVTSELLYISKPMTNALASHSVKKMIVDIVQLFQPQAMKKEIQLAYNDQNHLFVHCDETQIKQVLINLIKNAIEVMEEPGTITITTEEVDGFVQIDVSDEGPGIDESISHKLNEPFFTTKQDGTGLGLVITKQIVDRHYGTLEVLANKSVGCTFRVRLPISEEKNIL